MQVDEKSSNKRPNMMVSSGTLPSLALGPSRNAHLSCRRNTKHIAIQRLESQRLFLLLSVSLVPCLPQVRPIRS